MGRRRQVLALVIALAALSTAFGREWSDTSGNYRIEAKLLTVKNGKVYLEKEDGAVVAVELSRLSPADLEHLQSLPECREYFKANPVSESAADDSPSPPKARTKTATRASDESKVGEVRRISNLGWGVTSLAFSPDGTLLAVGKMDQAILVYRVDKGTQTASYDKLDAMGQVTSLAFTPDGKKLLSGGFQGRIQVWDVGEGGTLTAANRFVGHSAAVHTISTSADGKTVLSGGQEGKLRAWDLAGGRELFSIDGFKGNVRASFITRSGKQGLGCDGETLALIDMKQGKVLQTMKLASHSAQAIAIAPDGSSVVVGDLYALRCWNVRSGQEQPKLQDRELQWTARFLPSGKYLLSGGRGKVNLWEMATRRKVYEFDTAGTYYVQTLACSPDNRHFAAIPGSAGQDLQLFRLPAETGKR